MGFLDKLFGKSRSMEDRNKDVLMMTVIGNVYSWNGHQVRKAGGSGFTNCIAEYKNEIYERTIGGVNKFTPEESEYIGEGIAEGRSVIAMCSHDGILYDATPGSPRDERNEVHETLTDELVATRDRPIRALSSHKGKLYDGGWYGICETFTGEKVSEESCESLCSNGNNLYAVIPTGIIDVFSGKEVAQIRGMGIVHGMCLHNYRLVDAEKHHGIRDTLKDEIILTYDALTIARGKRSPIQQVPNMISVNGLTYIAATRGKQAAFDAIESEYQDQLSSQTVRTLLAGMGKVTTEVVNFLEPGTELWFEQAFFMPNLLAEFNLDPQLGIIHGHGRGHSIAGSNALRKVATNHNIDDYVSLVKAFFEEGYHVKRVGYIHFASKQKPNSLSFC